MPEIYKPMPPKAIGTAQFPAFLSAFHAIIRRRGDACGFRAAAGGAAAGCFVPPQGRLCRAWRLSARHYS